MFDADRPIQYREQDRLSRAQFAAYLARCMLDHSDTDSLVIGLNGGWGSGKTSIINLIIEELHNAANNMLEEQQPIILNFSPWSYSGQDQLIYGFYRRLSSELQQVPNLANASQIIYLLELYSSFFTQQNIPKALSVKQPLFQKFKTHDAENNSAWNSGRDPVQVKTELNALLKLQHRKIIIFIDNISRLLPNEVMQVLQIVKSMADYSNTIYLLSYDKPQVVNAINQVHPGEGEEYIGKLVQLPFKVPEISQQDLENLLVDRLSNLIPLIPEDSWDHFCWADVYTTTLKYFFNSPRDITYYVNTVGFSYPRVKEIVNPVDYFVLSAIEVFEPEVYNGIRENKDLFTDLLDNVFSTNKNRENKESIRCDEIINRTKNIPAVLIKQAVMYLFPRIRKLYYPEEKFYHSEAAARRNRRICSPDIFDVYFRLSISSGEISESELQLFWSQTSDEESFSQSLLRLNQDGKALKFLEWLDGNVANIIPYRNIGNVIESLIDVGDLFPDVTPSLMQVTTPERVHRICQQLLRALKSNEERYHFLKKAFNDANMSLYTIVNEVILQTQQHMETENAYLPSEHRDLTFEQLRHLQETALTKIKFWAHIGRLSEHPRLLPILRAWRAWGEEDECRGYIETLIRDPRGLTYFLRAALAQPINEAITNLTKTPDWYKSLDNIRFFLPIHDVAPFAIQLFESDEFEKLKEEDQLAILIFLDLINAKTTKNIPKTS